MVFDKVYAATLNRSMPELPEVEVVRRDLAEELKAHPKIVKFRFNRKDLRFELPLRRLAKLEGSRIIAIHRRAKYLIFKTEKGSFLSHLGMTGHWRFEAGPLSQQKHDHVVLELSDSRFLVYQDPRRFGFIDIVEGENSKYFLHLGPEPLSDSFSGRYLYEITRSKSQAIKTLIMDQKFVVGVGNIYASESLFLSGIRPNKASKKMTLLQCESLYNNIVETLAKAIDAGGSSIKDFRSTDGRGGRYQKSFKVYGREGENCRCGVAKIRSAVIGGRNSFWCPACQK
jgi:formamidopyrimidine-DNA glycosylase